MRQREVFADVLERELLRSAPVSAVHNFGAQEAAWTGSPNPFLFAAPAVSAQMLGSTTVGIASSDRPMFACSEAARPDTTAGPATLPPQSAWMPSTPEPEPAPVRSRILMARERRALRELIALGADLRPDFTAADLRRAFRTLARTYHPDCHPDGDAATHARLARTFSELSEHHRCLLAVVEPVGDIRH